MRFWDASAIVPLIVAQPRSGAVRRALEDDSNIVAWWATPVECASALARLDREQAAGAATLAESARRLDRLTAAWREVEPGDRLRETAVRLLRTHPLRSADALQLAAAIAAADGEPPTLPFVTLDERLAIAAGKEGFPVVVPGE